MRQWVELFNNGEIKYGVFLETMKANNYPLYVENILHNVGMISYSAIENYDELLEAGYLKRKNTYNMVEGEATLSKKGIIALIKYMEE